MRVFVLLLSAMFAASVAQAQTPAANAAPADAPGVQVVKHDWSKERIGWQQSPFSGTNENFHEMQFRTRAERRAARASAVEQKQAEAESQAAAAMIRSERERVRQKGPARYAFMYKATVENVGVKAIKEIDWDYVFTDAATHEELGRREFTSDEKIAPGKKKELSFLVPTPPAQRISVYALDKKERAGLDGHVDIIRVLYADGTVWERR